MLIPGRSNAELTHEFQLAQVVGEVERYWWDLSSESPYGTRTLGRLRSPDRPCSQWKSRAGIASRAALSLTWCCSAGIEWDDRHTLGQASGLRTTETQRECPRRTPSLRRPGNRSQSQTGCQSRR